MTNPGTDENFQIITSLGFAAKLTASGVFVGGRDPQDFVDNDVHAPYGFKPSELEISVDYERGRLTLTMPDGRSRTAVYNPGLGCTLLPVGEDDIFFEPVEVRSSLPDPATLDWPMGDRTPDLSSMDGIDLDAMNAALDFAFDDSQQEHPQRARAMVVLHNGRIVGERYAPGFDKDSKLVSWSMGKTITGALIGTLMQQGHFGLDDPAPIEEWHAPGDPRSAITFALLLRMSSGLKYNRVEGETSPGFFSSENDHNIVHFGAINVFDYARSRPAEHPPNTVCRYRNCDPLNLGLIIQQTVRAQGEEYLTFPQRALFDKIGIRNMVLEPDPWGNFIMTGCNHGTARDWARFGQLHLQDGVWDGERILPEGWVDFISTPAPADPARSYAGMCWVNAGKRFPSLPEDMFWANGARGQFTMIIPSRNVVVARLGHSLHGESLNRYMDKVVSDVLAAIGTTG